jgi:copper chaperone
MTTKETLLDVSGMSCQSCVRRVEGALREVEGVRGVEVRLREGKVLVKHDDGAAPAAQLVAALRDAGYASTLGAAA